MTAIGNLVDIRHLIRAACLRLGSVFNQTKHGRETRTPSVTLQRYLNLLEASFQLVRLKPHAVNRTKLLVKSPKLYWSDPVLVMWLGGAATASEEHLEALVFHDQPAWRDSRISAHEVMFWRTTTGLELDFVIEVGNRLLPIEVKDAASPGYSDTKCIRAFRQEYPERFDVGLLLYDSSQTQGMSEDILEVPWSRVP